MRDRNTGKNIYKTLVKFAKSFSKPSRKISLNKSPTQYVSPASPPPKKVSIGKRSSIPPPLPKKSSLRIPPPLPRKSSLRIPPPKRLSIRMVESPLPYPPAKSSLRIPPPKRLSIRMVESPLPYRPRKSSLRVSKTSVKKPTGYPKTDTSR